MLLSKYQVKNFIFTLLYEGKVKNLRLDNRALKDFLKFPEEIIDEFGAKFDALEKIGYLVKPFGKKLSGYKNLYEIIIKHKGQWRAIYAYIGMDSIIILHCFRKKAQNTPKRDLELALKRLKYYI